MNMDESITFLEAALNVQNIINLFIKKCGHKINQSTITLEEAMELIRDLAIEETIKETTKPTQEESKYE